MNNLTLTKNEQDKFYEDGYIVLGPDRIFSDTEIQAMQSECYELFPQWEDGFQHEKSRKITFNLSGTVKNHSEISIDFEKSIKNKFFSTPPISIEGMKKFYEEAEIEFTKEKYLI
jgi:hypothetical protein